MIYDITGRSISEQSELRRPFWIFHLDCGRKFFSVANIKLMIDRMAQNGLNQLQLHFSENRGLRFALNDMTIVTTDGNEYDLSPCVSTDLGGSLTEANMDSIIMYARSKGIDVVPSLDMPGHMTKILTQFPQFKYNNSAWVLDATNQSAVKFGLALAFKYAKYFRDRGCRFWNIGADEIGPNGKWSGITLSDVPTFVQYINTVAEMISDMGMIPRAFSDGTLYKDDYQNLFNKNIQLYAWANSTYLGDTVTDSETLVQNGYSLINCNYGWYFILPGDNSKTRNAAVENANILKSLPNGTTDYDQDGACICVWCDNDTTADGGDASMNAIYADIDSFGIGIDLTTPTIDYPII